MLQQSKFLPSIFAILIAIVPITAIGPRSSAKKTNYQEIAYLTTAMIHCKKAYLHDSEGISRPIFSPNNDYIFSSTTKYKNKGVLFDEKTGEQKATVVSANTIELSLFNPNNHRIATTGHTTSLWSVPTGKKVITSPSSGELDGL